MYTNATTLTRGYASTDVPSWEPIRTRPRYAEDGTEVRYARPHRGTARHEAIARSLGFRR